MDGARGGRGVRTETNAGPSTRPSTPATKSRRWGPRCGLAQDDGGRLTVKVCGISGLRIEILTPQTRIRGADLRSVPGLRIETRGTPFGLGNWLRKNCVAWLWRFTALTKH